MKTKSNINFQTGFSRWKLTVKGEKRIPREKTELGFVSWSMGWR